MVWDTLTELRQIFSIVRGRNFVRSVVRKGLVCRRFEGKTCHYPITPPLMPLRLNDSRPFVTTGIDNFGPVYVKNVYGQSDKTYKAWITLYTCAVRRAIILDLIPAMDPSVLKRSIKGFISCRGCPSNIISDNSKNSILQETGKFITSFRIEWHFNLPLAPWHGDFFERLIRIVKLLLKKQLKLTVWITSKCKLCCKK